MVSAIIGFIIGFIVSIVVSEVVYERCDESLLFYMLLPFAYILRPIWRAIKPLRHPKLTWWYMRHGISPYCDLKEIYKLDDDDWNELMMFVTNEARRERLEKERNYYLGLKAITNI